MKNGCKRLRHSQWQFVTCCDIAVTFPVAVVRHEATTYKWVTNRFVLAHAQAR